MAFAFANPNPNPNPSVWFSHARRTIKNLRVLCCTSRSRVHVLWCSNATRSISVCCVVLLDPASPEPFFSSNLSNLAPAQNPQPPPPSYLPTFQLTCLENLPSLRTFLQVSSASKPGP